MSDQLSLLQLNRPSLWKSTLIRDACQINQRDVFQPIKEIGSKVNLSWKILKTKVKIATDEQEVEAIIVHKFIKVLFVSFGKKVGKSHTE